MAYVDLNPIRAGMEKDLTTSDFTSIQQRLFDYAKESGDKSATEKTLRERAGEQAAIKEELGLADLPEAPLMPFDGSSHTDIHTALPFTREDYLDLVDKTGRAIRDDKRGFIPSDIPPIISRLGINPDRWLEHIQCFGKRYAGCAGSVESIQSFADRHERHWCKGIGSSKFVYDRKAA